MRKVLIITVMVAVTLAGMAGALLVRAKAQASLKLEASATFVSFSEVENAKTVLQTLADQFILEIRQARASDYLVRVAQNQSAPAAEFKKTAARLLGALEEFRGTQQESALTRELLTLLHSGRELGSWMDLISRVCLPASHRRIGRPRRPRCCRGGRQSWPQGGVDSRSYSRCPNSSDLRHQAGSADASDRQRGGRFSRAICASQHEGVTPMPADMQL